MALSWNLNGLRAHSEELKLIISRHKPFIVCLQETHLLPLHPLSLRGFNIYRFDHDDGLRAHGGVAVLIRDSLFSEEHNVRTDLQTVCVRVHLPSFSFTVCSIYIPPGQVVSQEELEDVFSQLPAPFFIAGDFNAHNPLWGGTRTCPRGSILENIIDQQNLILLNSGNHTHYSMASNTFSSIDLALCSPSLSTMVEWTVLDDLHGSDHFPILVHFNVPDLDVIYPPRWLFHRADWDTFSEKIIMPDHFSNNIDTLVAQFTDAVLRAATIAIPKSTCRPRRVPVPWWNADCATAVRDRKQALARLNRFPTASNLIDFKRKRARARLVIRESKTASWRAFISSLSCHTPPKVVWRKIRQIGGRFSPSSVPGLLINGNLITSPEKVVEELACHYENSSSSLHYSPSFLKTKSRMEKCRLDFSTCLEEDYNAPFSMDEFSCALTRGKDSAPGPDQIHNQMLKHLPEEARIFLLRIFNKIWMEHTFPRTWREAIIIPIPKEGKDRTKPSTYRPISLTSCICKLLERMVNTRLVWHLEQRNLLTPIQCGFRKNRSTMDHLVTLTTQISTAFVLRQHLVAIFFDLEKAYDTTWRYGILRTIHSWGLRGRLPLFLVAFLSSRYFRVRLGDRLSASHHLENGVPQGSILSVTLFAIAINSIASIIREPVKASLFVDDFAIFCSSKSIQVIERQLQLVLNKLQEWTDATGFKFSASKTSCMHFCRIYHLHNHPDLSLGSHLLPFVDSATFLGLLSIRA